VQALQDAAWPDWAKKHQTPTPNTKTAICRASKTTYKRLLLTQEVQEALALT
jgi:hypothetical protein